MWGVNEGNEEGSISTTIGRAALSGFAECLLGELAKMPWLTESLHLLQLLVSYTPLGLAALTKKSR